MGDPHHVQVALGQPERSDARMPLLAMSRISASSRVPRNVDRLHASAIFLICAGAKTGGTPSSVMLGVGMLRAGS
jgi:hypothetical protein